MILIVILAALLAIANSAEVYTCEDGWRVMRSSCFKRFTLYGGRNWYESRKFCQGKGGDLIKIADKAISKFIFEKFRQSFDDWTGLNDRSNEGDFRWSVDNTKPIYTDWMTGQRDTNSDDLDCVTFRYTNSSWNTKSCGERHYFVCEKPAKKQYRTCNEGGTFFNGKCYLLFQDEAVDFYNAFYRKCRLLSNRARPLSIHDQETMDFVRGLVKPGNSYLTGMWVYMYGYKWFGENSQAEYFSWAPGEPAKLPGAFCVYLNASYNWDWSVSTCDKQSKYYAACEYIIGGPV